MALQPFSDHHQMRNGDQVYSLHNVEEVPFVVEEDVLMEDLEDVPIIIIINAAEKNIIIII